MIRDPVKIAMPKGRLWPGVQESLKYAGFVFEQSHERNYTLVSSSDDLCAKLFKPRAIPQLVALNVCGVGFVGLDIVKEGDYQNVEVVHDLGLNSVEIVVATHLSTPDILQNPPKRPLVIATEYENQARVWAMNHNLAHIIIQTYGSTEGYVPEEADLIMDCVETGTTIEANGLMVLEHLYRSSTCMVVNRHIFNQNSQPITGLVERLKEVTHA